MKMTLSIPDAIAHRFEAAVPERQRSEVVSRLIEKELVSRTDELAEACRAANQDVALIQDISDWQSFDDAAPE